MDKKKTSFPNLRDNLISFPTFIIEIILFSLRTLTSFNSEKIARKEELSDPIIIPANVSKGIVANKSTQTQNLPLRYDFAISLGSIISLPVLLWINVVLKYTMRSNRIY